MNKVELIGRLGFDAKQSFTRTGKLALNFSLAVDDSKKTDKGWERVGTNWINVTYFCNPEDGAPALKKGALVYVFGKLQVRQFTDRDGVKKYATSVLAKEIDIKSSARQKKASQGEVCENSTASKAQVQSEFDDYSDIGF